MAWTTPRTYVTAELITAAILNTDVRDNLRETWHIVETTALGSVSTPSNAGIYGLNSGTIIASLTTRTYPGFPVIIQFDCQVVYESATTDGSWVVGLHEGNAAYPSGPVTPGIVILMQGLSGQYGSGLAQWQFTPTNASHVYTAYLWSGNGTGGDVAVCTNGRLRLWEKGGA